MRPALALLLLPLAGCARDAAVGPPLSVRPAEARGFDEPAAGPVTPTTADPALESRLNDTGRRLDAQAKSFDGDAVKAERAVGSTGAAKVGSDAWIAAQTALATLDRQRAQAAALASDVDGLARERAEVNDMPYPALTSLQARADAEAAREGAAIDTLNARVPQP